MKKLISSSADIIVTTNQKGHIKVFNPAAEDVFGYKSAEVKGHSVLKLYKDQDMARKVMHALRAGNGVLHNFEVEIVDKDGEIVPLSLSASILFDEHHQIDGTLGVSRDLRPIQRLQQKLLDAEKRAAIQKTVVSLSHLIHNQLMSQVAVLSHLREDIKDLNIVDCMKNEFIDGFSKALSRSFQISNITKTLQNPPEELKDEKYIGDLEYYSLPQTDCEIPSDLAVIDIKPIKILVADDEPVIREGFAEFLRHFGLKVETASDGKEAIDKIKKKRYDLIISDIKMPHFTGYDVFREAKAKDPDVKIILMTAFGYDPEHTIVKARGEGLKDVFFKEKPFDLNRLLESIQKLFEG
jgi:PAS domain S-box-containing protein